MKNTQLRSNRAYMIHKLLLANINPHCLRKLSYLPSFESLVPKTERSPKMCRVALITPISGFFVTHALRLVAVNVCDKL